MEAPDRYFTLQEAQGLVPWLQQTFDAIEPLRQELARAKQRVQRLMVRIQSNGGANPEQQLEEATHALHEVQERIDELAYAIVERGIILRTVEGLVDFPSIRDGRLVHLCWLAGESQIAHWHESDVGFAGRQPL